MFWLYFNYCIQFSFQNHEIYHLIQIFILVAKQSSKIIIFKNDQIAILDI